MCRMTRGSQTPHDTLRLQHRREIGRGGPTDGQEEGNRKEKARESMRVCS
jgi:hypothetical protein